MTTDWILMRRAAIELERALRGGKVTDAGLLDDGRFAVRVGALRGRGPLTLAVDAFGSPPLITLEEGDVALAGDPGWTRAMSAALRGMRLASVRARRGDRVIAITLGTQSRFGVENEARLVLELVPRYGNIVLLRERSVIAAAKQFSPAENEARSVQIGAPYQPPPLPQPRLDRSAFVDALAAAPDAKAYTKALGAFQPLVPRILAESLVAEAGAIPWPSAAQLAGWLEDRASGLLSSTEGEPEGLGAMNVYREGGRLVHVHVLPLHQFPALERSSEPALLPLWREARGADDGAKAASKIERKRSALAVRIAKRREAIEAERSSVEAKRADADGRDALRAAGDALYTHALEVPDRATVFVPPTQPDREVTLDPELDAKENAQRYFARYRKAADALPHLERRLETLAARSAALDEFAFETGRADGNALDEIASALDELDGKKPQRRSSPAKARELLRIERPSGARIIVGRSPRENVEVTFKIARPDDLWFHARNIPGSHVVLQPPPGGKPDEDDLDAAADLAATHSRARSAPRVEIDFTERKYVRKQRDGAPGLVWYINARTRVGRPRSSETPITRP
ncbi:MAG: hypothetical protein NVSMB64_01440 [Candidatus Velthaea sp.]